MKKFSHVSLEIGSIGQNLVDVWHVITPVA